MLNVYIICFSQPTALFGVCIASVPRRRRRSRLQVHLRGNMQGDECVLALSCVG